MKLPQRDDDMSASFKPTHEQAKILRDALTSYLSMISDELAEEKHGLNRDYVLRAIEQHASSTRALILETNTLTSRSNLADEKETLNEPDDW